MWNSRKARRVKGIRTFFLFAQETDGKIDCHRVDCRQHASLLFLTKKQKATSGSCLVRWRVADWLSEWESDVSWLTSCRFALFYLYTLLIQSRLIIVDSRVYFQETTLMRLSLFLSPWHTNFRFEWFEFQSSQSRSFSRETIPLL